jgi:LCP family protein required for cell wall assembly
MATPALLPTSSGVCGGPAHLTIALLGVDNRQSDYTEAARTDAISLVNVNFDKASAAMLAIPRDVYVALPNLEEVGITQDRINTAYVFGEVYGVEGGGPAEVKATIELNFGVRVDRYMLVNFAAFEAAVDTLGGIDVYVPKAIYDSAFPADDGSGQTQIFQLAEGWQHLDGRTALHYARTRHQDDDYHRVQRQQAVLLAIRDKLLTPEVIPQWPTLLNRLSGLIRTDLTATELAQLACIAPQIDRSAIAGYAIDANMVIPWTTPTGGSVSIPNRAAIAPLIELFLGQ